MIYGLFAVVIGVLAILYAKFVLPKMQAMIEQKNAEQKAKYEAKKAAKQAKKDSENK